MTEFVLKPMELSDKEQTLLIKVEEVHGSMVRELYKKAQESLFDVLCKAIKLSGFTQSFQQLKEQGRVTTERRVDKNYVRIDGKEILVWWMPIDFGWQDNTCKFSATINYRYVWK